MTMMSDVRIAVRMLRRTPGFTTLALLTMALGIGAVSAVFSLVNAVLIEGLPFERPDRLVFLRGVRMTETPQQFPLGLMDIEAMREAADVFEAVSPVTGARPFNLTAGAETEHVNGEMVGAEFFGILRVRLPAGRPFSDAEAAPATAEPLVILSDVLWRNRFASDPDVLGRDVELNDRTYRVIGVAPPGFRGLSNQADLWLPIGMAGPIYGSHYTQNRQFRWLSAIARLQDHASLEGARATTETIASRLRSSFPVENDRLGFSANALEEVFFGSLRTPLLALVGAAAFVLLIACVNAANMLLARGAARGAELAVRRALGADGRRLARQLLAETMVLCAAGAAGGLLLAYALPRLAYAWAPASMQNFVVVEFDPLVVAVALAATSVAAILSGLLPSALLLRQQPVQLMREGGRGAAGSTRHRFQRGLVVAEVTLALALLIGASAMARGFNSFLSSDLGLIAGPVMTLRLDLTAERFKQNDPYWAVARDVLARASAVPGVEAAALEGPGFPTSGSYAISFRRVGASPADPDITGLRHHVSPGYFGALGIPIRAGRDFDSRDTPGGERALVISVEFAESVWPDKNPIGERLVVGQGPDAPVLTVVGVVGNVRHSGRTDAQAWGPDVYVNIFQSPARSPATLTVLAKSQGEPSLVATALTAAVREAAAGVPPYGVVSLDERLDAQTASGRFAVLVMAGFALAALVLAVSGVYGVVAYVVGQRTREIGIRMALGSSRRAVLWLMLRLGLAPVGAGIVLGVALAYWGGRYLTSLLYGLSVVDPVNVLGMIAALALVASAATFVPAMRATRVSPTTALRSD